MRVTAKGQVTIPQHIREALGLLPDSEVEFELKRDGSHFARPAMPRGVASGCAERRPSA